MTTRSSFAKPLLVYAGIAALTRIVLLVAQAVFVRRLGDVQFGVYSFAAVTEQILYTVVAYAFTNALGAKYAATQDAKQRSDAIGTALVAVIVGSIGLGVAWQFGASWFSETFLVKGSDALVVARITGISVGGTAVLTIVLTVWQLDERLRPFVIATVIQFAIAAGGGVVAVTIWDLGSPGAFGAWAVGTWVAAAFAVTYLLTTQTATLSRPMFFSLARYGVPLVPGAFAAFLLQTIDRVFVRKLGGIAAFSRYSVVILIVSGLNATVIAAFRRTWTARMWAARGSEGESSLHRSTLAAYLWFQAGIVLIATSYGDVALRVFGGDMFASTNLGPAVGVAYAGYVLLGVFDVVSAGVFFVGKTHQYSIAVVIATIVEGAVVAAFASRHGAWAGAAGNLVAYLVFFCVGLRIGRNGFDAGYRVLPIAAIGAVTSGCAIVLLQLRSLGTAGEVAAAAAALLLVLLLWFRARAIAGGTFAIMDPVWREEHS